MKKILSLFLVLLFCLSIVGCSDSTESTGELSAISLPLQEALSSDGLMEESSTPESEIEHPVLESTASIVSEKNPSAETDPATSSSTPHNEMASVVSAAVPEEKSPAQSAAPLASQSEEVSSSTPIAQFAEPPDHLKIHEHTEYTLEAFLDWFNSDEALTEENGAYRKAVEYYRQRKSIPLVFATQANPQVKWYKLYSDGRLCIHFDEGKGSITIRPFTPAEATTAQNGIVSHWEAKGKTIYQSVEAADCYSLSQNSPERFILRTVSIDSQPTDAVFSIRQYALADHITGQMERFVYWCQLYWIQNGFHITYTYGRFNLDESLTFDDSLVSQLEFEDIALTAASTVVSEPLLTE